MTTDRIHSVDTLRGIAVAGMLFAGMLPPAVLPRWMYHAQNPPPFHAFNPAVRGITWVDLVFPIFLFVLGVSIPFALSRPTEELDMRRAVWKVIQRTVLILAFAVYVRHISFYTVGVGTPLVNSMFAVSGYLLLFPMFGAAPARWGQIGRGLWRGLGWGLAVLLMTAFKDKQGGSFNLARSDIIILVLGNVYFSGALLWLATRREALWRGAVLCILLGLRLSREFPGWAQMVSSEWPGNVLVNLGFQQYLFIVIPGTFAGELLLQRSSIKGSPHFWKFATLSTGCVLLVIGLMYGFYNREAVISAFALLVFALAAYHSNAALKFQSFGPALHVIFFAALMAWVLEPFEGGIQKGHATLSFYFAGTAIAATLLLLLHIAADLLRIRRPFLLLSRTGSNPLLAYAAAPCILGPLIYASGRTSLFGFQNLAATGVAKAVVLTLALCGSMAYLGHKKVFLSI